MENATNVDNVRAVFALMCKLKQLDLKTDSFLFYSVHLPGRQFSECGEEVHKSLAEFCQEAKGLVEQVREFDLPLQRFKDTLELCALAFSKDVDVGLQIQLLERVLDLYQLLLEGKEDLLKAFTDDFDRTERTEETDEPCCKKRKL